MWSWTWPKEVIYWPRTKSNMCNREISSRHIDCFLFREALRLSGPIVRGSYHPPPLNWRRWRKTENWRGLSDVTSKNNLARLTSCHSHSSEPTVSKPVELDEVNNTTTCISWIFDIRDLRSGQLRDLPMFSQWAKIKFPLFRIGTFPFTRNGFTLAILYFCKAGIFL